MPMILRNVMSLSVLAIVAIFLAAATFLFCVDAFAQPTVPDAPITEADVSIEALGNLNGVAVLALAVATALSTAVWKWVVDQTGVKVSDRVWALFVPLSAVAISVGLALAAAAAGILPMPAGWKSLVVEAATTGFVAGKGRDIMVGLVLLALRKGGPPTVDFGSSPKEPGHPSPLRSTSSLPAFLLCLILPIGIVSCTSPGGARTPEEKAAFRDAAETDALVSTAAERRPDASSVDAPIHPSVKRALRSRARLSAEQEDWAHGRSSLPANAEPATPTQP